MAELSWALKSFADLTSAELYAILRLRSEVFVVEQNCAYQDLDNKDLKCLHLSGFSSSDLAAYARLVPADVSFTEISIGRVVSSRDHRRSGAGRALMTEAIKCCYKVFGQQPIRIGAQLYLKKFYESFGFVQASEEYDEDGIPHIEMIKSAPEDSIHLAN